MSAADPQIKLGLTLYSLTPEFHSREWSLERLIGEVAERGLGPGVEMVGFQSIKGFPHVTDEVADRFRAAMATAGLEQSCLSVNADIGRRQDRFMTEDENVEVMELQLAAAAKLGFPTIRFQWGTPDPAILRLLPTAERLGVKMGCEVHSPQTVDHPRMVSLRELCEKTGSPYLGFIPDFGSSVRRLPPSLLNAFRERGLPDEAIALVESTWAEDRDGEQKRNDLRAALREMRIGDNDITLMVKAISLFGRQDIERWADVMQHVVHVHAKYFEIDDRGEEPAVDYPRIVEIFIEGGYEGYFSSEYEAWHWVGTPDGFTAVGQHHALLERCLAESRIGRNGERKGGPMYENYMICEDGFENVTEDGVVTGFRFRIRITYYRGVVLSLIEGFEVTVDGEEFPREAITFTVRDVTYTLDELEEDGVTRWEFGEKATINVRKPGGLAPGEHTIEAAQQLRLSYIPWPLRGEATKTLAVAA